MAASPASAKPTIDRQTVVPFHLKLFYSQDTFRQLSEFPAPEPGSNYLPPLPPHLQIYTWQSCTLRELATLLTSALPNLLPDPAVGTRICFRLIYPDTKGAIQAGPDIPGRYISKEMGSVVVGPEEEDEGNRDEKDHKDTDNQDEKRPRRRPVRLHGDDADKSLQDMRFVIGDYIECAILPPLPDGSVAPPLPAPRNDTRPSNIGGGMRAFGGYNDTGMGGPGGMRNGYGGGGNSGFGRRGGRGLAGAGMPSGEWRRGERVPDSRYGGYGGYGGGGNGNGNGNGNGYGARRRGRY
ncbi:Sin3 associated polypeptide p18 [Ascosphaera apis ARSEF 7405]|uniref:Sin3 associated polypeptide p18 n=1 Tax=Ascosphaera apis ARSEF 7405 TaxID=392613 RepID=A0A167XH68_9EURO|nr:Sin3 associated polypeptide p18 [Ascosphaera apis ARSEF 7405]